MRWFTEWAKYGIIVEQGIYRSSSQGLDAICPLHDDSTNRDDFEGDVILFYLKKWGSLLTTSQWDSVAKLICATEDAILVKNLALMNLSPGSSWRRLLKVIVHVYPATPSPSCQASPENAFCLATLRQRLTTPPKNNPFVSALHPVVFPSCLCCGSCVGCDVTLLSSILHQRRWRDHDFGDTNDNPCQKKNTITLSLSPPLFC